MARQLFKVEKGFEITGLNQDFGVSILTGSGAPAGTSGDTDLAAIGSIYLRTDTGEFYSKKSDTSQASDWEVNGSSSAAIGSWRSEKVSIVTNDVVTAGTFDPIASPFTDDDGTPLNISHFLRRILLTR